MILVVERGDEFVTMALRALREFLGARLSLMRLKVCGSVVTAISILKRVRLFI
jgi:hypothetical protein